MKLRNRHFIATALSLLLSAVPCLAQDMIAKQAPIDKHMKTLDTLQLRTVKAREEAEMPATNLYQDWSNTVTHRATELPDSFKINLKHFAMPCDSRVVTSNFGARWGRQHKGLDIKVYIGDTIRAAFTGKVRIVKYEPAGYGKYVVIRHNNGLETVYGHMSDWLVEENQVVKAGEPIGLGGNTGRSTGSHLHFETRLCGVALNPALMFDFRNQDVVGDYYVFHKSTYQQEAEYANTVRGKIGNGGYTASDVRGETMPGGGEVVPRSERVNTSAMVKQPEPKNVVKSFHKVAAGETLSSIARKRGISVDELCKLNHLTRDVKVRPNQLLRYQ